MNGLSMVFLLVFALILSGSYIFIRRAWVTIRSAALLCGAGSISSLIVFGMAQDLAVAHALVMGIVVGLLFTGAVVTMAAFFQSNQPTAAEMESLVGKKTSPK